MDSEGTEVEEDHSSDELGPAARAQSFSTKSFVMVMFCHDSRPLRILASRCYKLTFNLMSLTLNNIDSWVEDAEVMISQSRVTLRRSG